MVDTRLVPAIKRAITANELGDASPYALSYARLGSSGASFGMFQGDTAANEASRETLAQALRANNADADAVIRIMAAVSQPCPNGDPLSPDDRAAADAALSCDSGRALVDAMDDALLRIVLGELDNCSDAAAVRNQTIASQALLFLAVWVNMTGAPDTLTKFLAGTPEAGLAPPIGPVVTSSDVQSYLQASLYFRLHPRAFVHMQESVNAAVALLPAA